jgi:hypothetical protein
VAHCRVEVGIARREDRSEEVSDAIGGFRLAERFAFGKLRQVNPAATVNSANAAASGQRLRQKNRCVRYVHRPRRASTGRAARKRRRSSANSATLA